MDKIRMTNVTLAVTLRCDLKCKLCAVFAPYYEQPPHYSTDTLKRSIERYFDLVEYVDKFTISGGEALLRSDLPDIIDFLAKYLDHIGMLEILTNGTIVPNERLLKSLCVSPKVNILVNDYGPNLSTKVTEIINALESYQIAYRYREQNANFAHCGGWVDISDLSDKRSSDAQIEARFKNCAYPGAFRCFAIFGDKAYICGVYLRCKTLGIIPDAPGEYVDFSDASTETKEEQIQKILHFFDKPYSACAYCNGFCSENERFVPAEQINMFMDRENNQ